MQNNQKDKSDLTFLGSGSIPCPLENRVKGGKPPYYTPERELPKKLKGLHSPIYVFSHFVVGSSLWYKKKSGGGEMCEHPSDISSREAGCVKEVLCKKCISRVWKKIGDTGNLFDFKPKEYPICPECLKKARETMKAFTRDMEGSDDADVE